MTQLNIFFNITVIIHLNKKYYFKIYIKNKIIQKH
jgi:hypothetical protein